MTVRHYKRVVDRQKGDSKASHYSPKQKLEAVTAYLMLGKVSLVAATTGIPEDTLRLWKSRDWWKVMADEVRTSNNVEVTGRLRQIVNKSMNVIEDRLEHGDFQYNPKTGAFTRRPVGAKVAGDIMTKAIDKQILIDRLERQPQADQAKIEDRLKSIQDKLLEFSRFAKAKNIPAIKGDIIDVQATDRSDQELVQEASSEAHVQSGSE
jgi:transposase-like protein